MFTHLLDYSYKRSFVEAIGFYFAYVFAIVLGSMILAGYLAMALNSQNGSDLGSRIGSFVSTTSVLTLSFLILKRKNLFGNFLYIILFLVFGLLTYFIGGVIGMMLVSFFSTRAKMS